MVELRWVWRQQGDTKVPVLQYRNNNFSITWTDVPFVTELAENENS